VKETQGKILQICHTQGKVKVDKTTIVENGIQVEGIVHMKVLYSIGNDEMPFYSMEAMLPFSHVVEARGITEESTCYLKTDLEQLTTTMSQGSRLEVRAVICLNALVLAGETEPIIDKIEEQPLDMEKIRNMPGVTVYFVKPEDTLWDIARRFYTTVETIREQNSLDADEPAPGSPLLLAVHGSDL
jgi:LysM repeat protein